MQNTKTNWVKWNQTLHKLRRGITRPEPWPESFQEADFTFVQGLGILKFDKNTTDLLLSIIQFGGLGPQKSHPRGDGTEQDHCAH